MDKKQEIEKMTKLLYWCCDDTDCNDCKYFDTNTNRRLRGCIEMHQAETLYNAGYRKADELLVEIENLKEVNQALQNENYNLELRISHIEETTSKQIITRILVMIYRYFQDMDIDKRDIEQYTHTLDYIICKEFGLDKEVQDE